jgi:signal transduction histidine kinase
MANKRRLGAGAKRKRRGKSSAGGLDALNPIESEQRTLARLGQVLASSLDFEDTLTKVVQLVADEFGDFAVLYLREDDHPPRRMRAASRDPSKSWYSELLLTIPADAPPEHPVSRVIATKQPLLLEGTPAVLQSLALSDEHARALALLEVRSVMTVPLITGETCVGALVFQASSRTYGSTDLRLAEEIGRQVELLIENAKLHRTAQQAIRARDHVLRVVAHDLRNSLGTIFLEASILALCEDDPEGTVHEAAAAIQQSANFMKRLIQDLLDVASIESGRLSVDRSRVLVSTTIAEFVKVHEAIASTASLELRVDVSPDVSEAFADRDRLLQVLENLVSNAERFTPRGGRITIGAKQRDSDVLFWVSDTGSGIDAAALPYLFDRFSAERKIDQRGTGFGLPIVKGIVEAHGGRVWAESNRGTGSTFFFTLPIAPDIAPSRRGASTRAKARPGKGTVDGDDSRHRPPTPVGR